MKALTIRDIDPELVRAIKVRASQSNLSANKWILQALKNVVGPVKGPEFNKHHDLDVLAGGWTRAETAAFMKNTKLFERIDKDFGK